MSVFVKEGESLQDMVADDKHFSEFLDFSAAQLEDAYSRMDMSHQNWTKHTPSEIDYILAQVEDCSDLRVLDLGCGMGRHSAELARRGLEVVAADNSSRLLDQAVETAYSTLKVQQFDKITFLNVDCRKAALIPGSFDLVICLYDVIGSYRTLEENLPLLDTIFRKLRTGGVAVISVMNMDLTNAIATNRAAVRKDCTPLLKLKSSDIMHSTGDVFNPDFFLLDSDDHLVYRKEKFLGDGYLNNEYVIADYRFTMDEICTRCESRGLHVVKSSYVQAGHWNTPLEATNPKAILLVLQK